MASNDKGASNLTQSSAPNDPTAKDTVDDPAKAKAAARSSLSSERDVKRAMRGAAGVVEARPGIIEDTHIDPLSETSNDDDGWANVTPNPIQSESSAATRKVSSTLDSAKEAATGAAKTGYGTAATYVEEKKAAMEGETQ